MKKNSILSGAILMATLGLTGCMQNDFNLAEGEGSLRIRTSLSEDVTVVSRSVMTQQEIEESLILWVCKSDSSVVREYKGLATVPNDIKLVAGNYFVEGWAGDSVSASFEKKFFYGHTDGFAITNDNTTNVSLTCSIQNVVVSVTYQKSVSEVLKDYTFTIGHKFGSLTFEGDTQDKGYFMMSSVDKDLAWTLEGTTYDGKPYRRSGVITDVQKATEYAVTIAYNYGEASNLGGGYLDISVDESPIDPTENEFDLALAPTIMGLGSTNLNKTVSGEAAEIGLQAFLVAGASPLTEVVINCGNLCNLLGYPGQTKIDLLNMSDKVALNLESKGLSSTIVQWEDSIAKTGPLAMQVVFYEEFISSWPYGDYPIDISALDTKGKSSSATLHILITQAKVDTEDAELVLDWGAPYAVLKGRRIKEADSYGILYSKNGSAETYADATLSGDSFSVKVDGLNPGDKVTYRAVCDYYTSQPYVAISTKTAQMPQGIQMPNNSFEKWITDTPMIPADNTNNKFWDTGNHGSATMSKNVTTPSDAFKHSGERSACLQSQFVGIGKIGKFAAGNIFIGEYLDTEGTDGILGFGRKFDLNYKPKALSFWVRYQPQAVSDVASNLPSSANIKKGDPDQGMIYFALLSDSQDEEYNGKTYPVIVKTKSQQFFNKDGDNVIAYGEYIFSEATDGSGMVNIVVPFDYTNGKEDLKPTYIMCTCAASRYGDYFTGGPSTMYIDDVEIIY